MWRRSGCPASVLFSFFISTWQSVRFSSIPHLPLASFLRCDFFFFPSETKGAAGSEDTAAVRCSHFRIPNLSRQQLPGPDASSTRRCGHLLVDISENWSASFAIHSSPFILASLKPLPHLHCGFYPARPPELFLCLTIDSCFIKNLFNIYRC